jgi:hypothetical protein
LISSLYLRVSCDQTIPRLGREMRRLKPA